ncbi:CPBP family intramembrane glutamic endopeptidase [Rhodococcus sp. BH5]|uniref:CPBP family intramembrane glutamic endopeptidase n=1 Tax=Rhodococcus sp. BH5 TaxID=2871702 RepID=UPI003FA6EDF7
MSRRALRTPRGDHTGCSLGDDAAHCCSLALRTDEGRVVPVDSGAYADSVLVHGATGLRDSQRCVCRGRPHSREPQRRVSLVAVLVGVCSYPADRKSKSRRPLAAHPIGGPLAARHLGAVDPVVGLCHAATELADVCVEKDRVVGSPDSDSRRDRKLSTLRIWRESGYVVSGHRSGHHRRERDSEGISDPGWNLHRSDRGFPPRSTTGGDSAPVRRPRRPALETDESCSDSVGCLGHARALRFRSPEVRFGNVVSAFIGGALFTVLALYTRSLWPAIAAHGFANLIIEVQWVLNS